MKNQSLAIIATLILFSGCAKVKVQQSPEKQIPLTSTEDQPIEESLLQPTDSYPADAPPEILNKYEPVPTEIKTKSGTLQLGQTQFTKVKYLYNSKTHSLQIKGHLKIIDKNKSVLAESDFELHGNHKTENAVVQLNQKNRADKAPVLRAKVTCLDIDENENYICDKSIVDFFVLYQKQFYTDQFETQTEAKKSAPIKNELPPVALPEKTDEPELQSEGDEASLNGRYQGQVQTTNLEDFLKPEPVMVTPAPSTPIEVELPTPTDKSMPVPSSSDKTAAKETETPVKTAPIVPNLPAAVPAAPKAVAPAVDKVVNSEIKQAADGSLRAYNQAVGFPDRGSLRNATSLLEVSNIFASEKFFNIAFANRQRYYGTYEMSQIIVSMGKFLSQEFESFRLYVGNISSRKGGLLNPHKSHQIGMDVDIAYPTVTASEAEKTNFPVVVQQSGRKFNSNMYSTQKTFELFKYAFKQTETPVDRIFADKLIIQDLCKYAAQNKEFSGKDKELVEKMFQSIDHVDGHGDHFHLRLKCTDAHPACRSKIYVKAKGCSAS